MNTISDNKKVKVCHLSSVHQRYDTRVFLKQLTYLSEYYDTHFIVADGLSDEVRNNVNIIDVGKRKGRLERIFKSTDDIYKKALEVDASIYHIHDPELLLIARKLLSKGYKVVFDAHENFSKQLLSKPYLKPWQGKLLSKCASMFESFTLPKLSGLIAATPSIANNLMKYNQVATVNNFPMLKELHSEESNWDAKKQQVCYVGAFGTIRGAKELFSAAEHFPHGINLKIAGNSSETWCQHSLERGDLSGVQYLGSLNREQVKELLSESMAGIVTFLPLPNHIDAQPNKMFEYMSAGIPVICSNFELWRDIIESNECGLVVDPEDPYAIAQAIEKLVSNPELAERLGNNGRRAVTEKYNWETEFNFLNDFYEAILND